MELNKYDDIKIKLNLMLNKSVVFNKKIGNCLKKIICLCVYLFIVKFIMNYNICRLYVGYKVGNRKF